jgi:hypothetical protein
LPNLYVSNIYASLGSNSTYFITLASCSLQSWFFCFPEGLAGLAWMLLIYKTDIVIKVKEIISFFTILKPIFNQLTESYSF